jgi:hypothetical protein
MRKLSQSRYVFVGTFVGLLIFSTLGVGSITTGSWYLNQSNALPDGVNYAKVSITADDTTGQVNFTVDAIENIYTSLGDNFGIQKFGFNCQNITSPISTWSIQLPSDWEYTTKQNMGETGKFDIVESGKGNSRQEPLSFTITLPDPSEAAVSNFAVSSTGNSSTSAFFSAHIAGFTADESTETSHWVYGGTTVVPEPCTLLFCLVSMTWIGRNIRSCGR